MGRAYIEAIAGLKVTIYGMKRGFLGFKVTIYRTI